jgi:hypothetical protein
MTDVELTTMIFRRQLCRRRPRLRLLGLSPQFFDS